MENETNNIIDQLILSGALEIGGIDEKTGEFLFAFTPKIKEVSPDLYREHINHVNKELMGLWEKGFLDISITEETPIVRLTAKAFEESELSKLSKEDKWSIEEIKRLFNSQEL